MGVGEEERRFLGFHRQEAEDDGVGVGIGIGEMRMEEWRMEWAMSSMVKRSISRLTSRPDLLKLTICSSLFDALGHFSRCLRKEDHVSL